MNDKNKENKIITPEVKSLFEYCLIDILRYMWEYTALYNTKKNNISIKEQSKNMIWVPGNNIIFMMSRFIEN